MTLSQKRENVMKWGQSVHITIITQNLVVWCYKVILRPDFFFFLLGCASVLPVCCLHENNAPNLSLINAWSAPVFRNRFVTVSQNWLCSCRTLAAAERSGTVADSSCARYRCIYSFTRRLCHTVKVWNVPESPAGTQTNKTFISVNPSLLSSYAARPSSSCVLVSCLRAAVCSISWVTFFLVCFTVTKSCYC